MPEPTLAGSKTGVWGGGWGEFAGYTPFCHLTVPPPLSWVLCPGLGCSKAGYFYFILFIYFATPQIK